VNEKLGSQHATRHDRLIKEGKQDTKGSRLWMPVGLVNKTMTDQNADPTQGAFYVDNGVSTDACTCDPAKNKDCLGLFVGEKSCTYQCAVDLNPATGELYKWIQPRVRQCIADLKAANGPEHSAGVLTPPDCTPQIQPAGATEGNGSTTATNASKVRSSEGTAVPPDEPSSEDPSGLPVALDGGEAGVSSKPGAASGGHHRHLQQPVATERPEGDMHPAGRDASQRLSEATLLAMTKQELVGWIQHLQAARELS
jgi:hypothetical protein